jgi:hypothetical protein
VQWLGCTPRITLKHYLMARKSGFDRALGGDAEAGAVSARKFPSVLTRNTQSLGKPRLMSCDGQRWRLSARIISGADRIRTPQDNAGNIGGQPQSGAEFGALDTEKPPKDPELGAIIDAWPTLSESIKAGILAMVRAMGKEE